MHAKSGGVVRPAPSPFPPFMPHHTQLYKWDEPSREAIEGAFDTLLKTHFKDRQRLGFQPAGLKGTGGLRAQGGPSLLDRFKSMFDPTVTARTIINEGAVFGAFALW